LAPSHPIATIVVAVSIHSLQRAQKSPRQTEWFQLGHAQAVLAGYAKTVNEQWPELLATKYHVLALQFDRTIRQSPLCDAWHAIDANLFDSTFWPMSHPSDGSTSV
jgi:hypothetical protein